MSVLDIVSEAEDKIKEYLRNLPKISADKIGLDKRAGKCWIDVDNREIIVNNIFVGPLDYFGGFEYIKEDDERTQIGQYTIYGGYNSRVEDSIDHYEEHHEGKE